MNELNQLDILIKLTDEELINICINYNEYGYSEIIKDEAINILRERGVSEDRFDKVREIKTSLNNQIGDKKDKIKMSLDKYKKLTIIYSVIFILFFFTPIGNLLYFFINSALLLILIVMHMFNMQTYLYIDELLYGKERNMIIRILFFYFFLMPLSFVFNIYQNIRFLRKFKKEYV